MQKSKKNSTLLVSFVCVLLLIGCSSDVLKPDEKKCVTYVNRLKTVEPFKHHFYQLVRNGYCVVLYESDSKVYTRARVWFRHTDSLCIDSFAIDKNNGKPVQKNSPINLLRPYISLCTEMSRRFHVRNIGGIAGDGDYITFGFSKERKLVLSYEKKFPVIRQKAKVKAMPTKYIYWMLYSTESESRDSSNGRQGKKTLQVNTMQKDMHDLVQQMDSANKCGDYEQWIRLKTEYDRKNAIFFETISKAAQDINTTNASPLSFYLDIIKNSLKEPVAKLMSILGDSALASAHNAGTKNQD